MILNRGRIAVEVASQGAAITSLRFEGIEMLLQPQGMDQTDADSRYLNALVGRVANRIEHGRVPVDGETHFVSVNENGNTLHGGEVGWSMRAWRLEPTADGIVASYTSPDGEMGFPGEVAAWAEIALVADDAVEITYLAKADCATPVSLTHHLYFNLSGGVGSVLDHHLTLASDAVTPVREGLIPTGELMSVAGTPFDFRAPRRLGEAMAQPHPQMALAGGIDHNFVLERDARPAIRLHSPESGVTLEIETDQPGVQIYAGQKMTVPWSPYQALAIEPQGFPDAVNQPAFPNAILHPGETYRRQVLYRFSRG